MARTTHFSSRAVIRMLRDLRALAATPDGRQLIAEELERTINRSKVGGAMLHKIRLMYAFFRDPAEPIKPKLLIGAALLYLINPFDVINDFAPFIGLTDDFAAIALIWNQLRDVLSNYEGRRQQRAQLEERV